MTIETMAGMMSRSSCAPARTPLSVEFETFWRALPRDGLVPGRAAFRPERAARFLRHILLCEALPDGHTAIRMRLVGSEFEARIGVNVKGQDYLQFLSESRHASAIEAVREIVKRPCGLWQVMPVNYERGYAQNVELTIFPLGPGPDGKDLLLALTQTLAGLIMPVPTGNKIMAVGTAIAYEYIDVGAGVPA